MRRLRDRQAKEITVPIEERTRPNQLVEATKEYRWLSHLPNGWAGIPKLKEQNRRELAEPFELKARPTRPGLVTSHH